MLSLENGLQSAVFLKSTFQTVDAVSDIEATGVHVCLLVWKMSFWAVYPPGLAWCLAHGKCLGAISRMKWTGTRAGRIATRPHSPELCSGKSAVPAHHDAANGAAPSRAVVEHLMCGARAGVQRWLGTAPSCGELPGQGRGRQLATVGKSTSQEAWTEVGGRHGGCRCLASGRHSVPGICWAGEWHRTARLPRPGPPLSDWLICPFPQGLCQQRDRE